MIKPSQIKVFWQALAKEIPRKFIYEYSASFAENATLAEKKLKQMFLTFDSAEQKEIQKNLFKKQPHAYLYCLFLYFFSAAPEFQKQVLKVFLLLQKNCPNNIFIWKDYLSLHGREFSSLLKNEQKLKNLIRTYQIMKVRNISSEVINFLQESSTIHVRTKNKFEEILQQKKLVDLKLGYSCNDACVHCVVDGFRDIFRSKKKNMDRSTIEYKNLLKNYRRQGYVNVVFTGGEPSIRPDLVELLRFAWEIGFTIQVQTNGRYFSQQALISKLNFGKKDIAFTIALHGPIARIHDAITQRKGSHRETVAGIKNLLKAGYQVMGKMVLSNLNYRHIKENIKKFISLGVKMGNIAFPHAQGAAWKNFDRIVPFYKAVAPYAKIAINFQKKYPQDVAFDFEMMLLCFLKGDEEYCAELDYSISRESTLDAHGGVKDDWSIIRKSIKTKFSKCKKCKYDSICEGPWEEYPRKRGDAEFVPIKGKKLRSLDLQKILNKRNELKKNLFWPLIVKQHEKK